MKNDDGAGAIVTLIFVFLLSGILFVIIGFGIDRLTLLASKMFVGLAASQMRFDVFSAQLMILRVEPFIILIGIGINYWINRIRTQTGVVELGALLTGAAEMIIITLVLMMFTLYGGYALDSVVGVVNNWQFTPIEDTFTIIQYLSTIFYSFMVLLSVAVVAMFVVQCVKITDYIAQY